MGMYKDDVQLPALFASLALVKMIDGNVEDANRLLSRIPRSERGRVSIALEDLIVKLSRLGTE